MRIAVGLLVALMLAAGIVCAQGGVDITVHFTQAKYDELKDALTAIQAAAPFPPGETRPVIDDAYVTNWVQQGCKTKVNDTITAWVRQEQTGGSLDLSTLTPAQRAQVKALLDTIRK